MTNKKLFLKRFYFIVLFAVLGFGLSQVKFSQLAGANVSFTLFDFFAPISGAFLGLSLGIISVFAVSLTNLLINGNYELGPIIRLFPTLFAVYYFSLPQKKKDKTMLAIPFVAMVAFLLHPEGRAAWYYALFWLIPIFVYFRRSILYLRSLGATFTAHAVGGAVWIWAFNLPASVWQGLIPVVAYERLMFAAGITVSYVVVSWVLKYLILRHIIPAGLRFEKTTLIFSK